MARSKYIEFFRNHRGYYFKGGIVTVGYVAGYKYFIQMGINNLGVLTIYRGKTKPLFKHIGLLHLLIFTYVFSLSIGLVLVLIGAVLSIIGRLSTALSEMIFKITDSKKFPQ